MVGSVTGGSMACWLVGGVTDGSLALFQRPVASLWRVCSGNRDSVDRRLVSWYAEDQLRQKYSAFVKALDVSFLWGVSSLLAV